MKISAIQDRLLDALLYMLERRGVEMALTLGSVATILADLRHTTEFYHEYTKKLRIISSNTGAVEIPPLFLEVITFT